MDSAYPRQNAWILFAGDTWTVNDKLTLDYGLRWDYYSPSSEKYDRFSFFDPVGPNPGAGGRPGRLAFAGDEWGAASYGRRYPEEDFYGGFAPRFGAVYRFTDKTVLRSGWGIFYTQAFYPGWGGGISQDGFSTTPSFNTSLGGIQPAFFLEQGLPQNFERPPVIQSDYRNGQGILYRPIDANKRPYSHQWNITVDRELGRNIVLSVAYVGSAGRRLPSSIDPINAIDPSYLSMGDSALRPVQAWHDEPQRRAAPVRRLGGADDGLRAFGCPGAASVSAVLRQPAGPERERRLVALQLTAGQAREALLERHLRARLLHAVEDDFQRVGQHPARSNNMEWRSGCHLAVRGRAERSYCGERFAACPVGRVCVRTAGWPGEEVHGPGRRHQRAAGRVADEHDFPLLVGIPHLLPRAGNSRAMSRERSAPDASPGSSTPTRSSLRTRAVSTRARDRCSTRTRSSP